MSWLYSHIQHKLDLNMYHCFLLVVFEYATSTVTSSKSFPITDEMIYLIASLPSCGHLPSMCYSISFGETWIPYTAYSV